METMLLPVAFSPDTPEGFPPQAAPQEFGNFTEVLEKQYFMEGNPVPEDSKISPGDPAASAMAHSFLAAIWAPNGMAFPQEKPTPDPGFAAPAAKEEFPAPSPIELSSLFIFPQPSPGDESRAGAIIMNEEKTVPLPEETLSPFVTQDRERGTPTRLVFFPSGNGEGNQETIPEGEKISGKPVQGIFPPLLSNSSEGQKASPTLQESPLSPDSSTSQTSLEAPLRRELAGNMNQVLDGERKAAPPVDSSTSPIPLEEVLFEESIGKTDMPSEKGKMIVPFLDSPTSPVSPEEFPPEELAGKMELSAGGEKKFIRPSTLQESNGSEKRPVQEWNDFLADSQPSSKMEAIHNRGEVRVLKGQGPLFWAAKEATGAEGSQNLQERGPLAGNQAYILDSLSKDSWTHFSANATKGQEKAPWAAPDIRPFVAREIQNPPSFLGALTDPVNRQVENGGEIKAAFAPLSERPDSQAVFQQVGQRVLWLIRNDHERIRITLEPPELGQVFLEIDRHKEHIKTILWTENPLTKANLENSQAQIQRIIESEGFKLEKFDVFMQQDPGWFQGRKEKPGNPDSWKAGMPAEERVPPLTPMESVPGRSPTPAMARRYLDLLV